MPLSLDAIDKKLGHYDSGNPGTRQGAGALLEDLNKGNNNLFPVSSSPSTRLQNDLGANEVTLAPVKHSISSSSSSVPSVSPNDVQTFMPKSSGTQIVSQPTMPSYGSQQPEGLSGSFGANAKQATTPINLKSVTDAVFRSVGLDPDYVSEQSQWEQQRAKDEDREARTTNYWGEEYKEPSSGVLGSMDNQLDVIGNTPWNDYYARDAIANGADPDEVYNVMHHDARAALLPWGISGEERDSRDQAGLLGGSVSIDDGTYDYDHMTADNMTGTQYMHYVQMGMGGRPVNEIDPTQVYSKRREAVNNGFIPFTPDALSYANMIIDNVADVPARLGSYVANTRERIANDISPYGIIVTGEDGSIKRVDGPEFDRIGGAYVHQMERQDKAPTDETMSLEFPVPDLDGNMTYHYGYLDGVGDYGDGTYVLEFSDGSSVDVDQTFFDSISNEDGTVSMRDFTPVTKDLALGDFPDLSSFNDLRDVIYHPNLVMPDGTELTYDEAQSIYYDHEIGDNPDDQYDDKIKYDINTPILGLDNRPSRLNEEVFGDNGINLSSIGNNVMDWTLGSLPISTTMLLNPVNGAVMADLSALPWVYSASNASSSMSGLDPATYDVANDSYGLAFGNYDKDGRLRYGVTTPDGEIDESLADNAKFWNMLGNAAVPLTEEIVGPVGEEIIPVRKLLGKGLPSSPTTWEVLKDFGIGMAEEGIEEDLGNIFDELTSYGPQGMFARQAVNEDGVPMYDLTGHEVRDTSTPLSQRIKSFANPNDLANAFAGGALVDAAMQSNPLMPGNLWGNLGMARNAKRIRQDLGLERFVDPREVEHKEVPESYLSQFDNELI